VFRFQQFHATFLSALTHLSVDRPAHVHYALVPTELLSWQPPVQRRSLSSQQHASSSMSSRSLAEAGGGIPEAAGNETSPLSGVLGWVRSWDVVGVASAQPLASLLAYTVACGRVEVQGSALSYDLSIGSSSRTSNLECSTTLAGNRASTSGLGAAVPGQCLRCPFLDAQGSGNYTLFLVADQSGHNSDVQVLQIEWPTQVAWQQRTWVLGDTD
jgi:hypothetical protein